MALIDIQVPDIGDFAEVGVIELLVKPGDTVAKDQSLITVESDKASMEIPSSHAGVVKEIVVKIGDKVAEGSVIIKLEAADAAAAAPAAQAPAPAAAGAGAGDEAAGAGAGAAPSAASSDRITEPSATLSPILILSSLTTPAWLDGISIEALSDSTVISDWSLATVSPGCTSSSITPTSAKSPMSGTLISTIAIVCVSDYRMMRR